jgi:hypothetical protein
MNDPMHNELGIPTQTGLVIFCECGETKVKVRKRTKTSVSIQCKECGRKMSVKGGLAPVRVNAGEIVWIKQENHVVYPDPEAGCSKICEVQNCTAKADSSPFQGRYLCRFHLINGLDASPDNSSIEQNDEIKPHRRRLGFSLEDDQFPIVHRALEAIRVMHWRDDRFRQQVWHGAALELLCADWLAGLSPRVESVLNRMESMTDKAMRAYKQQTGNLQVPARQVRTLKTQVRDEMYKQITGMAEKLEKQEWPEKFDPETGEVFDGEQ